MRIKENILKEIKNRWTFNHKVKCKEFIFEKGDVFIRKEDWEKEKMTYSQHPKGIGYP